MSRMMLSLVALGLAGCVSTSECKVSMSQKNDDTDYSFRVQYVCSTK